MNINHYFDKEKNKLNHKQNSEFAHNLVIEAINLILSGGIGNKQKKVDSLFFGLEITEIIKKGEVENWEFRVRFNSDKFGCGAGVIVGLTTDNINVITRHFVIM
jgi:hypothetical protein